MGRGRALVKETENQQGGDKEEFGGEYEQNTVICMEERVIKGTVISYPYED